MSQATLERPAATKPAGKKPADRAANPREKIICQFSELLMGIVGMIEDETGDCVGRVLEVAGGLVRQALGEFVESDSDMSYHTMLDADSLIQAAAALADKQYKKTAEPGQYKRPQASATEAQRLAALSDAILCAQDQRLTDIASGKVVAIQAQEPEAAEPAVAAAQEDKAETVTLTREAARLVCNCTYQIETMILMMQDMARRDDDGTTGVHLPIVVQALGVRIEQLNQCISDTVYPSEVGPSPEEIRDKVEGQAPRLMQVTQPA